MASESDQATIDQHNANVTTAWKHAHAVFLQAKDEDGMRTWFAANGRALLLDLEAIPRGSDYGVYKAMADDRLTATGVVHLDVPGDS
jgi:hypothetical protein